MLSISGLFVLVVLFKRNVAVHVCTIYLKWSANKFASVRYESMAKTESSGSIILRLYAS